MNNKKRFLDSCCSSFSAEDSSWTEQELLCLSSQQESSSCASSHLCYHHLNQENYPLAYRYALLSLEACPSSSFALTCLSLIYYHNNDLVRSSFYSTRAYQLNSSFTISLKKFIKQEVEEYTNMFDYFYDHHRHILLPSYSHIIDFFILFNESRINEETRSILSQIFNDLQGDSTLYSSYKKHLNLLPKLIIGPDVIAYEEFLNLVESVLVKYSQDLSYLQEVDEVKVVEEMGISFGMSLLIDNVLQEDVSCFLGHRWPQDKTINIHIQPDFETTTAIFAENVKGMSDVLARLGVPFRFIPSIFNILIDLLMN